MEIRCRKGDCKHNTGSSCCAKTVRITEDKAECASYDHISGKEPLAIDKGKMFRVAEKLPPKNTNDVPLRCCADKCLFNKHERCTANGIAVLDEVAPGKKPHACTDKAVCATFVEE